MNIANIKCSLQLHVDGALFYGSMLLQTRNYLDKIYIFQLYPDTKINDLLVDALDTYYIQPIYQIYKEYIETRTGHQVNISGSGGTTTIQYEDTGAFFQFSVLSPSDSDVDVYYNYKATDAEAITLIYIIETICRYYPMFNIGEIAEENKRKQDEIRERIIDEHKAEGFDITKDIGDYDSELPD